MQGVVWYPCLEGVLLLQLAKCVYPLPGQGTRCALQGSVPCWQKLCRTHRAAASGKHACGGTSASVSTCQEAWEWAFMGKPSVSPEHVSPTAGALRSNLRSPSPMQPAHQKPPLAHYPQPSSARPLLRVERGAQKDANPQLCLLAAPFWGSCDT